MSEALQICEVGPRDGLQNQTVAVSTADKRRLIRELVAAGLKTLEATSFVHPKAVPQMADADQVMPLLSEYPHVRGLALLMNERGYERALAAGARSINVVVVCSETLAQKNNRRSSRQTLETARDLVLRARKDGLFVRVTLAAAWHCPYEGRVDPGHVLELAAEVSDLGIDELTLADTVGLAHPGEVRALLRRSVDLWGSRVSGHFHDTQALGLANALAALDVGVRALDTSVGGLGGCPFAKGAAGNLATEDLVLMAEKMGFETGVDLDKLWSVVESAESMVRRSTGGRTAAWWWSRPQSSNREGRRVAHD